MASVMKWSSAAVELALALLLLAAPAIQAQNPYAPPGLQVRPGLTPQQWNNLALFGRATGGFGLGGSPYVGGGFGTLPGGFASITSSPYGGGASFTSTPSGDPYGGG